MHPYEYSVVMRIRHPSLNLTKISERLTRSLPGMIPGRLCNVGEERITPKGQKLEGVYKDSWFVFSFSEDIHSSKAKSLTVALYDFLERLEPCEDLFHQLAESGGNAEFFIGLFIDENSGLNFDPDLLRKLGELNIELGLDIYPPDAEPPTG
jgi:hypothetical protein